MKNAKQPKIVRPNRDAHKNVTFLWIPGVEVVDLVYRENDLMYAIWNGSEVKYKKSYDTYSPSAWIKEVVQKNSLKLPSEAVPNGGIKELAGKMKDFIHRYFDCPEVFESVAVQYALHTWMYEHFQAVPYLRFLGLWGTGKSRATEVIGSLCYRPTALSGSSSPAALYRIIEPIGGTLQIDEADFSNTQVGTEVAKILNSGYQKGVAVWKAEKNTAGEFVPTPYDVYGPKVINGRKQFRDEATESRCITHRPNSRTRTDVPLQLPSEFYSEAHLIRNQLLDWRLRNFEMFDGLKTFTISERLESLGLKLQPRSFQLLEPLLSISVQLGNPYIAHLIQYAKANEQQQMDALRCSVEASLVKAYLNIRKKKTPTCLDVASYVRELEGEDDPGLLRWLTPRKVSTMLREMGFQTIHGNRGAEVSIDPAKLSALCQKFGVELPTDPVQQ